MLGITGERDALAASALVIARRLKAVTDRPVLVGVGISTPQQAVEVCEVADGVVVGSAIVRRALETGSPDAVGDLVGTFRAPSTPVERSHSPPRTLEISGICAFFPAEVVLVTTVEFDVRTRSGTREVVLAGGSNQEETST